MSPRVLLLGLATAAVVAVDLHAGYDANEFEIKEESKVFQMGMFPYLYLGGAQNVKPSKEAWSLSNLAFMMPTRLGLLSIPSFWLFAVSNSVRS